jgi:hypothetical protein
VTLRDPLPVIWVSSRFAYHSNFFVSGQIANDRQVAGNVSVSSCAHLCMLETHIKPLIMLPYIICESIVKGLGGSEKLEMLVDKWVLVSGGIEIH